MSTFSKRPPGMMVRAGRMLAKSSNSFRSPTLTERKPVPTGVVSGPLRASEFLRMLSTVASGSGVPVASTAAIPASSSSQLNRRPVASSTLTVSAVISGPMPSPGIRVTSYVIGPRRAGERRPVRRSTPHRATCRGRTRASATSPYRCGHPPPPARGRPGSGRQARARIRCAAGTRASLPPATAMRLRSEERSGSGTTCDLGRPKHRLTHLVRVHQIAGGTPGHLPELAAAAPSSPPARGSRFPRRPANRRARAPRAGHGRQRRAESDWSAGSATTRVMGRMATVCPLILAVGRTAIGIGGLAGWQPAWRWWQTDRAGLRHSRERQARSGA